MHLPRAFEETDACPSGYASCIPSSAGTMPGDSSPTDQQPNHNFDQTAFTKPGAHRYIGIGMVAGMAFLVLVLWICLGRWPRRIMGAHGCCGRGQTEREESPLAGPMSSAPEKWHQESPPRGRQKSRDIVVPSDSVITEPGRAKEGKECRYELNWELQRVRAVSHQGKIPP